MQIIFIKRYKSKGKYYRDFLLPLKAFKYFIIITIGFWIGFYINYLKLGVSGVNYNLVIASHFIFLILSFAFSLDCEEIK